MAVMTSFHAEKCCHLVGEREAYAAVFRQFLIYSSFVLLFFLCGVSTDVLVGG